jgi:hypothetical protein
MGGDFKTPSNPANDPSTPPAHAQARLIQLGCADMVEDEADTPPSISPPPSPLSSPSGSLDPARLQGHGRGRGAPGQVRGRGQGHR